MITQGVITTFVLKFLMISLISFKDKQDKYMLLKSLFEATVATDDEYYQAVDNYHKDPRLLDVIKMSDRMHTGEVQTEKSESDNFIVRYVIEDKTIKILGIVTKFGKMKREDLRDFFQWMDRLIEYIDDDYVVEGHPNHLSKPLANKLKARAAEKGIDIEIYDGGEIYRANDTTYSYLRIQKAD